MSYQANVLAYTTDQIIASTERQPTTPSMLSSPNFLMCPPFSFHTADANNAWMEHKTLEERTVDTVRAFQEFQALYHFMVEQGAFIYLLPVPADCSLQDLVFSANAGLVLHHLQESIVIVSNFTSPPRYGETPVIENFFKAMGYRTIVSPHKFEGEADLKYLYDNIYIGGYAMRSEYTTYEWMEENFDMNIIKVKMHNGYLYHLDCNIFPITSEDTMIYTEGFTRDEIKAIEKVTNILPVDKVCATLGMTNSVRVGTTVLNMKQPYYHREHHLSPARQAEIHKNNQLEKICGRLGLQVRYFALDEFFKGGAALSCMIMHLNRPY